MHPNEPDSEFDCLASLAGFPLSKNCYFLDHGMEDQPSKINPLHHVIMMTDDGGRYL